MSISQDLNEARKNGFRPSVVSCCVNENKVLMLYNKEFGFWMFPQGGIANNQEPDKAIVHTLTEDLGQDFVDLCAKEYILLGDETVEFAPGKHNISELKTDEGEVVEPKGKKYYFYAVYRTSPELTVDATAYSEYFWVTYKAGTFLASKIHQKGKKRITLKALDLLKEKGLIQ